MTVESSYLNSLFQESSVNQVFSDVSLVSNWLRIEVALVAAQAEFGLVPKEVVSALESAAQIENIDLSEMRNGFHRVGFPILPFVRQLAKACDPETARWIHYGATTQDILDTGAVLQIRDGLALIEDDIGGVIGALSELSRMHRDTVMAGRTFQQLAAPITFGYKVAIWLDEMLRHHDRLQELKPRVLVGQCSGAVGTFATLGEAGPAVQRAMMQKLGLGVPAISWHVARDSWAELVSVLAMIAATLGKIANEIAILMRSEIGEVSEPFETGRGASTTLPQKRNPISCEPIIAIAHRMRELVGSQVTAMIQEHERGVGQMHLEWLVIPDAFILSSASLSHARYILENLVVRTDRMKANLLMNGGQIMAEAVMMALAPKVGKQSAHEVVYRAAGRANDSGISLREALLADSEVSTHLSEAEIDSAMDPANYLGSAREMIDSVLSRAAEKGFPS